MSETQVKFLLGEQDIPTHWVNLMADLPGDAPPPLHPGTKEPAGPDDLTPIFPMELILQEFSAGAPGSGARRSRSRAACSASVRGVDGRLEL